MLTFRRSAMAALSGALFLSAPAGAHWLGTEPYTIQILLPGDIIHFVDTAAEVQPDDVMYRLYVGDGPTAGSLSVVGEGDFASRKTLGGWNINNGTANVEGVVGTNAGFNVGSSGAPGATAGVLNILGSDIDLGGVDVYQGTLNVYAGSKIQNVEVFDEAFAYVTLFSQIGNLTTHAGAYAMIQQSIASSDLHCDQVGTVLVQDGTLRCGRATIENGGVVEIEPLLANSVFDVTNALTVRDGSLSVSGTIATTGSIVMGGSTTHLGVAGSNWANAGALDFQPSAVVGPVEMTVGADTQFHNGGLVRVSGHPSYQQLTVTGAGAELEIDGDLRIGEYVSQNQAKTFSGNVTVADGATVIVHGTLVLKPLAVLNLEPGGTVYAEDVDDAGTIHENGGELILPEPADAAATAVATAALGALARRRRIRR